MIKANHKKWADFVFNIYINKQFKSHFHSFNLIGDIPKNNNKSILLLSNHSSWWDGFFTYYLNKTYFNKIYHIMMLEHKLEEFHFFNKLGAFSIKHDSPKSIIETLNYSADLLNNKNNLVNIYPEGEMTYSFTNNFNGKKGILKISDKLTESTIYLLGMKIVTLHEEYPQVFFNFQEINKNELNNIDNIFSELLINMDKNILNNNYKIIYNGKKSKGN